ncbi:MAG: DUF5674 family protein [Patescibacteria group bacterium]
MIITKKEPFTEKEIANLKKQFDIYIKTVIDIKKGVCSAGMDRHFEGEEILLKQESLQSDVWGGGVDLTTNVIDCNSFINIRPKDKNLKNEIQDPKTREKYIKLTEYFFKKIL